MPVIFVLKKVRFHRRLQKLIGTDQDETSSIKASYNKGFRTIVLIRHFIGKHWP